MVFTLARIVYFFYHHKKDMHKFLQSDDSVSRMNYFRILVLASVDIVLTLPIGEVNIVLLIT